MNHDITPQEIKEHFHMIPLDQEGGVYCQTYISDEWLPEAVIPGRKGRHTVCSAILYLLSGDTLSRMHRLPTEEIFTAPLKTGVNGTVCAALPLVNNGSIIEDIRFTVREGRIVEAKASRGEDVLNAAISVDDGARYFGEVALVPYDSPIRSSGLLFYNTLYDENASCHLAFGEAYPECIVGGERMTREELDAHGLNHSLTHVDFMVGTADLSITGTTHDGRELPVFRSGNFAL